MEYLNNEYSYAGFFSSATIGAMHFQDILIALVLGFFGAAGGYLFKIVKDLIQKKRGAR